MPPELEDDEPEDAEPPLELEDELPPLELEEEELDEDGLVEPEEPDEEELAVEDEEPLLEEARPADEVADPPSEDAPPQAASVKAMQRATACCRQLDLSIIGFYSH